MKKSTVIFALTALFAVCLSAGAQDTDSRFMRGFSEEFNSSSPSYFRTNGNSARYSCGVDSYSEEGTKVLMLRIQPTDPAGAGRGPEINTSKYTHFGSYSARFRVPDVKDVQPNIGAVAGYFTYRFTEGYGLSEIDIEVLLADPRIIYVGTWTSATNDVNKLQRVGRTINLATGKILYTNYRSYHDGDKNHLFAASDTAANTPSAIAAIQGFDASKQFYTYGFDWYPDRMTWWIEHPTTGEKVILWDYTGTTPNFSGIPQPPTTHMFNFWHTPNWAVETNSKALEKPAYPYVLEIDWMKYEPFDDLNIEWRKKNNW